MAKRRDRFDRRFCPLSKREQELFSCMFHTTRWMVESFWWKWKREEKVSKIYKDFDFAYQAIMEPGDTKSEALQVHFPVLRKVDWNKMRDEISYKGRGDMENGGLSIYDGACINVSSSPIQEWIRDFLLYQLRASDVFRKG